LLVVRVIDVPRQAPDSTGVRGVWRSFDAPLRRLLLSDIIIRACEGLAGVFVVLYVTNVIGAGLDRYGILVAVQTVTSMLVYLPAARGAALFGRKPFVIASFACFALFPLAVVLSTNTGWLFVAFVVGGLREIGEPSRKAMIVDFAAPHLRGRTVGLYYLLRGISVAPAAAVGGLLWQIAPQVPFVLAGVVGLLGTLVLAVTVEEPGDLASPARP
jgi:MFS family permease